jgi:hypothetical protein
VTRRWQSQEEFNYDGVELMNVSAATSAFVRFVHAFWLRVCVVGGIGWTLMGGARSFVGKTARERPWPRWKIKAELEAQIKHIDVVLL